MLFKLISSSHLYAFFPDRFDRLHPLHRSIPQPWTPMPPLPGSAPCHPMQLSTGSLTGVSVGPSVWFRLCLDPGELASDSGGSTGPNKVSCRKMDNSHRRTLISCAISPVSSRHTVYVSMLYIHIHRNRMQHFVAQPRSSPQGSGPFFFSLSPHCDSVSHGRCS